MSCLFGSSAVVPSRLVDDRSAGECGLITGLEIKTADFLLETSTGLPSPDVSLCWQICVLCLRLLRDRKIKSVES